MTVRRPTTLIWLVLLFIAGTLAYLNSLNAPFVFDDGLSIERNPGVRLGNYYSGSWLWPRSLLFITFSLNHRFGGMDVRGYHMVNLLLHLLAGILVFFLARRTFTRIGFSLFSPDWAAGLSAAFFVLHPVQTESVTYISSRSELLSTLFYASALVVFSYWPEEKIGFLSALTIAVLFALGLGAKETIISLPLSLLLYDFIFIARGNARVLLKHWRFYAVFISLGLVGSVYLLRQWLQFFQPDPQLLSPLQYLLTQTRVIVRYIRILFIPISLNLDYDFRPSTTFIDAEVILCSVILAALIVMGLYWRRLYPILAFGILWFFVTLAPTSSVVPIQDVIFEHRLYLPLVGVCLMFPVLSRRKSVACVILGLLLIGTVFRNYTWADEIRLYNDIVEKSPMKARAYNALTLAYMKRGQITQAETTAKLGIANVSGTGRYDLYAVLGNIYLQSGRYDDAIMAYTNSLGGQDPALVYNNLGLAYLYSSQQLQAGPAIMSDADRRALTVKLLKQAENAFMESYHRDPSNLTSLDSYINVRHEEGSVEQWRLQLTAEVAQKENFETLYSLGKLAWLDRDYNQAASYFERALHLNSDEKLLHYNYAYALDQIHHSREAIAQYLEAIRHDPTFWQAHFNIALVYWATGDLKQAVNHLQEVDRLNPGYKPALLILAKLFIQQNEPLQARPYLQEILKSDPQNSEAINLWQRVGS